jgi:S-adenosylmethionine synthetase
MQIVIEELRQLPIEKRKIEIVERKGLGHPDYICDAIAENISVELSRFYLKKTGMILHHNIDKALLAAGEAEIKFGGGKILKPMRLVVGDRATYFIGKERIDVDEIVEKATKKWIKRNLRFVDPDKHLIIQNELKQASIALARIFKEKKKILGANDTSAAVGYAPLSQTERIVYETERFLNSKKFKKQFPESGEDIKVMGYRLGSKLNLIVAMAFVDRFIKNETYYFRVKEKILEELEEFLEKYELNISVSVNTLDKRGKGVEGVYLTVLGTSAESADSGEVGRGNRINGVIPLNRPISNEAAAGKNPVSHVGKIYNLLSFELAKAIYKEINGLEEVYVWLLSEIGRPVNKPKFIAVQIIPKEKTKLKIRRIEEIINLKLKRMDLIKKFVGKRSVIC